MSIDEGDVVSGAPDPRRATLGTRQAAVMDLLWARPEDFQTVREIVGALEDGIAYTTVMTVLTRLYRKGFVERQPQGRAWAYRPRISQTDHVAHAMTAAFNDAGDRHGALLRFVDQLSPDEQRALRDQLDRGSR